MKNDMMPGKPSFQRDEVLNNQGAQCIYCQVAKELTGKKNYFAFFPRMLGQILQNAGYLPSVSEHPQFEANAH